MSGRDEVYVVGLGIHPFGRNEDVDGYTMAERACRDALEDSVLSWRDIDRKSVV